MGTLWEVSGSTGAVNFRQKGTSNLVLENSTSIPGSGIEGQIFWKSDTDTLYIHNGTSFAAINGATAGGWTDGVGNVTLSDTSKQVRIGNGSSSVPALSFASDTGTGIYRSNASQLGIALGGSLYVNFQTNGLIIGNIPVQSGHTGSTSVVDYGFDGDADTGLLRDGANQLALVAGGQVGLEIDSSTNLTSLVSVIGGNHTFTLENSDNTNTASNANFKITTGGSSSGDPFATFTVSGSNAWSFGVDNSDSDSFKFSQSTGLGGNDRLIITLGGQTQYVSGSSSTPSISFIGDTATGMFRAASNAIGFTLGGTGFLTLQTNAIVSGNIPFRNGNFGTASNPAYTFDGEGNTGIYRTNTNQLGFTLGGTNYLNLQTNGLVTGNIQFRNGNTGTASNPAYTFDGDGDTGIYSDSLNTLSFSTGGVVALSLDSNHNANISRSQVGGSVQLTINNSDNTSSSSSSVFNITTGGTSSGDPFITFTVTGANSWSMGIDNSVTGDPFVIGKTTSLGSAEVFFSDGASWALQNNSSTTLEYDASNDFIDFRKKAIPSNDNTYDFGDSTHRWANIWGVNIHAGDIKMENNWAITEGDKVGHPEEGIILVSPDGRRFKLALTEVK